MLNSDEDWRNDVDYILRVFRVLPVTRKIARQAGLMRKTLMERGLKRDQVLYADCLIAATGQEIDAVVLSTNRKDFVYFEQFGVKWQEPEVIS